MAWDFETEPEFEAKLAWMREFVREELFPIETLSLEPAQLARVLAPLQEEVRRQGLWASHLPPELGGGGFGQVKLGLMHEILGQTPFGPVAFGNNAPDSGNAELIAIGIEASGREDQRSQWLEPLLAGEIRSAFSMTEPGAGADPTLISTTAVRDGDEWVLNGHKWFTSNGSIADVLVVMAVTNPDVHPYQGSSMILVPARTPGVDIVRDVATMEDPVEHFGKFGAHSEVIYRDVRVPIGNLVGARGRRLPARPAAARAGAHPPLHALARAVPSGLRHAVRAGRQPLHPRVVPFGEADDPELGRRLARGDDGGTAHDALRRLEDGQGGGGRRP